MNGSRGIRAEGTDGNDFEHRQQVASRYSQLASAKSFVSTTGTITLIFGIYGLVASLLLDQGHLGGFDDFGIATPLVVLGLSTIIYLLGTKVSSSVVDVGIVALHKLLVNIMSLTTIVLITGTFWTLLSGEFDRYMLYPTLIGMLFVLLISYRTTTADDEIIQALETKKGGKK